MFPIKIFVVLHGNHLYLHSMEWDMWRPAEIGRAPKAHMLIGNIYSFSITGVKQLLQILVNKYSGIMM